MAAATAERDLVRGSSTEYIGGSSLRQGSFERESNEDETAHEQHEFNSMVHGGLSE